MASGDTLLILLPHGYVPPATNPATLDARNGHPILRFDDTTSESGYWEVAMPSNYSGGGITETYVWMADGVTTNQCIWAGALERHEDDNFDLDSDGFAADQKSGAAVAPSADGEVSYDDVTHTDGAQMDSVAVTESFRYAARRLPSETSPADNLGADAQLLKIIIKET